MKKRIRREAFPSLAAFLRGYLHEDFLEEHGSLRGAVEAFCRDASVDERRQLVAELEALLRTLHDHSPRELRRFVTVELGSRWEPGSREELAGLLELVRAAGP